MWIRNQARDRLIDVNNVGISPSKVDRINYVIFYKNDYDFRNETEILAYYPTKERCLEVLDEIQQAMVESNVTQYEYYNSAEGLKVEYTYKLKTIYQMPEV